MSGRGDKLAVLGAAGACVACCAVPASADITAIAGALGAATAVIYPLLGVSIFAAAAAVVVWRRRRSRAAARRPIPPNLPAAPHASSGAASRPVDANDTSERVGADSRA